MPRKKRKQNTTISDPLAKFDDDILKSLAKECKIRSWWNMKRHNLINGLKQYYRSDQQLVDALNAKREPSNIEFQKKKPKRQYMHSFDNRTHVFKSIKVYEYSQMKLQKIQKKYTSEINKRQIAKFNIRQPKSLNNEQKNNIQTRKQYLWSHLIPNDALKMIFMLTVDKTVTVLHLITICKNWRNIIHQNENDDQFHSHIWNGYISSHFGSYSKPFDWKYLALIPDKYLKTITNISTFKEMDIAETKLYRTLSKCDNLSWSERCNERRCCDDAYDEEISVGDDSNIPLIIATLSKCPNLWSLQLKGWLCKDIFFAIAMYCKELQALEFTSTKHGKEKWLDVLISPEYAPVIFTVKYISIYRSFWVDTDVMYQISKFFNLVSIFAEKLNLCGFALSYLFGSDHKLEYIQLDRCFCYDENPDEWEEAFRRLARNNKVVRKILFNGADSFDDNCLKRLMGKNACPNLEELCINDHSCSNKIICKYKKAKQNVMFRHNVL